jgi:hypothetical protein
MRHTSSVKWVGSGIGTLLLTVSALGQSSDVYRPAIPSTFARMEADDIKTGTIWGDPSKPGMYVTRNRFAPGMYSSPHCHDQDRYVTVIKGTWYVSLGPEADTNNRDKMTALKPGSFVAHPAWGHHFDGAKDEEAIVQIMGMGPVRTINLTGGRAGAAGAAPAGDPCAGPKP